MSHTVVSFRALQLANEQRNAYGLRYNDYTRYRKHCANRTHRLRSSLKFTHGRGRDFKKLPPITPDIVKDGHLQLLLLEAERAWAYSQELSALALDPSNVSKAAKLRHSATSRFRRAVNWSTQLLSLCQALHSSKRLSAENLLELTVYTLVLNGRFLRARDEFQDALVQLSVARNLLDNLAQHATRSRDQALAVLFADDIGAEIRYCAHQLGHQKAYDVDGIVKEISEKNRNELVEGCDDILSKLKQESEAGSKEASRKNLATLMWEGQPVPVRNPELVDVLLKVQEADAKVENAKGQGDSKNPKGKGASGGSTKRNVAVYDGVLLALSDAEDVARKLVEAQQLSGSTSGASGVRDIHFVHGYIVYQLLSRRTERDLLLINALVSSHQPRPKSSGSQKEHVDVRLFPAVVKLLDTLLQNLSQMRTLGIVDESPDLASAVEARISFTKCRRCTYLARCYSPLKKYAEALTLMQRAQLHLREARSVLSTLEPFDSATTLFYKITETDCDTLDEEITEDSAVLKRDWFSFNGGSLSTNDKSYKKPLFFDIALNYVELDMIRLQERTGKQPPPAPKIVQPQVLQAQPQKAPIAKAKAEEVERPATPEPAALARGGLGGLLGGWWGRK